MGEITCRRFFYRSHFYCVRINSFQQEQKQMIDFTANQNWNFFLFNLATEPTEIFPSSFQGRPPPHWIGQEVRVRECGVS